MRYHLPIPYNKVQIDDLFWNPKLSSNRNQIPKAQYEKNKETGRISALSLKWTPESDMPKPHQFWDSDVAKWVEAASYVMATHPDEDTKQKLEEVVNLIVASQQPDGYINSYYTTVEPDKRWSCLQHMHELYCAGHLIEAAVAHYEATGSRVMIDSLSKYADYIGEYFGRGDGQKRGYDGHPEIELALIRLYRATGKKKYLELCKYFIDERGQTPHYFNLEQNADNDVNDYSYTQAHKLLKEQDVVVGHAVRAMYIYTAMTEISAEYDDMELYDALTRLWSDLVLHKLYVTGGIGAEYKNEGFKGAYDLPNEQAYAETCAAIGLIFWAHRMALTRNDASYMDVAELALYNGSISGMSLDGTKFFYVNPLESSGSHHRQGWYHCSCCPPNIARLLASLGGYIYSQKDNELNINLYIQSQTKTAFNGAEVQIKMMTEYPINGKAVIETHASDKTDFMLALRIPGWCKKLRVSLNGKPLNADVVAGYLKLMITEPQNMIELEFDMPAEWIYAHPKVGDDAGKAALRRGPLMYCLEQADNPYPSRQQMLFDVETPLTTEYRPELLDGVVVITGEGYLADDSDWNTLYRAEPPKLVKAPFLAVPYYAWDNREPGWMSVWQRVIPSKPM